MTIRIGKLSFAPGPVPTLAALAMVALTLWLGNWQMDRAQEKRERQALFEARSNDTPVRLAGAVPSAEPLLFRRVRVAGTWLGDRQFYVDNRIREGRAGFHVVTPLAIEGTDAAVLVNRGWVARGPDYPRPPRLGTPPAGRVEVTGLATRPPARVLELSAETVAGDVWQNLSIERFAAHTRLALLPVVVLADAPAPGLVSVSEAPDAGIAKHIEYAFTWFSLAATLVVLWVALNLKKVA